MVVDVLEHVDGVLDRRSKVADAGHEQIIFFCRDKGTGLRAIISIHSTRRGPALGDGVPIPVMREKDMALAERLEVLEHQLNAVQAKLRRRNGWE